MNLVVREQGVGGGHLLRRELWENATERVLQWGQSPLKITDTSSVESAEKEWQCIFVCRGDVRASRMHGCHCGSMLYLMESDCGSGMF